MRVRARYFILFFVLSTIGLVCLAKKYPSPLGERVTKQIYKYKQNIKEKCKC